MNAIIQPSKIKGVIDAPPSKSYTHRALIISALAKGESIIKNMLICQDTLYTFDALKKLGVKAKLSRNKVKLMGKNGFFNLKFSPIKIFCGNSGTTARFICSLAALSNGEVIIDGKKRLRQRPMNDLISALKNQNIKVRKTAKKKSLPIHIQGGRLQGGKIIISGKKSSQFASSLLLISSFAQNETILHVKNLASKPYIDITVDLMKTFGTEVEIKDGIFYVSSGQSYKGLIYKVEGDYSSASYLFAAAAVTKSEITVKSLNARSVQGDRYFLSLLEKMGCKITSAKNQVSVKGDKLSAVNADLNNYPDIVPTLCTVAAKASGQTNITNIAHLRKKESDRILSIKSQLQKMNIQVKTTRDSISITGGNLKGARVSSCNDHRIAMSLAVAALSAKGETIISKAEVVNKSYPNFFADLAKLGAKIKIS